MQTGAIRYKLVHSDAPIKSNSYTSDFGTYKNKEKIRSKFLKFLTLCGCKLLDILQTIFALKALKRKLFLKSRCLNSWGSISKKIFFFSFTVFSHVEGSGIFSMEFCAFDGKIIFCCCYWLLKLWLVQDKNGKIWKCDASFALP